MLVTTKDIIELGLFLAVMQKSGEDPKSLKKIYTYTKRQVKRPSKRRAAKPPTTPPMIGPGATALFEELPVDWVSATVLVMTGFVEVDKKIEVNVDPSEVTSELDVMIVGGGVISTIEDDVVEEVPRELELDSEPEVEPEVELEVELEPEVKVEPEVEVESEVIVVDDDEEVVVNIEEVDEPEDEVEVEEHEDPKRVVDTVTGTLTVKVAGTVTVVALPKVNHKVIVDFIEK